MRISAASWQRIRSLHGCPLHQMPSWNSPLQALKATWPVSAKRRGGMLKTRYDVLIGPVEELNSPVIPVSTPTSSTSFGKTHAVLAKEPTQFGLWKQTLR